MVDAERGGPSLDEAIDDGDDVAIAAITVAELRVGVQMAKGRRREKRERFVAAVLDAVSVEVYDLDVAEAVEAARFESHSPRADLVWSTENQ